MSLAAVLTPLRPGEATLDAVVRAALARGLVACNTKVGPFRMALFPADRVPAGWARIGAAHKGRTPC